MSQHNEIHIKAEKDAGDNKKKTIPDEPILAQECCQGFYFENDWTQKNENHDGVKNNVTEDNHGEYPMGLSDIKKWQDESYQIGEPTNRQYNVKRLH